MPQDILKPLGNIDQNANKMVSDCNSSDVFERLLRCNNLKDLLSDFSQLCQQLNIFPGPLNKFYPTIRYKIKNWKAKTLWNCLDNHHSHKVYENNNACENLRVLVVGAGPCGLRTAIEAQLLGAKVTVIEKRECFSRNNVVKLWPFVIQDLKNLGAKVFHGKLGTGDIEHISIKKLQFILLKICLFLGVEFFDGTCYKDVDFSSRGKSGWFAKVTPVNHPVNKYEVDVIISADGNKHSVKGFKGSELRGTLAIALTANFVNKNMDADIKADEICGVSAIYKQDLFRKMKETTGIDLENIVYYKGDTHYFVMTAKKQSLLDKGVILNDTVNSKDILHRSNVSKSALINYAIEAASYATNDQLPHLEFEKNPDGTKDVAIFDFTNMWQAENSCRIMERRGKKLLIGLVGDSLLEPFWPTGSGCAKGFFSSFDMCWMMKQFNSGKPSLEIIVERESLFRMLPQMTTENIKNFSNYSLNPSSRYANTNKGGFLILDALPLLDTDNPDEIKLIMDKSQSETLAKWNSMLETSSKPDNKNGMFQSHSNDPKSSFTILRQKIHQKDSVMPEHLLIKWFKDELYSYPSISVNMTSLKDGTVLCAMLHRYRPHLIDFQSLNKNMVAENNDRAFSIFEREFGIKPILTGKGMLERKKPNSFKLLLYLTQIQKRLTTENRNISDIEKIKILALENQINQLNKQNSSMEFKMDFSGTSPKKNNKKKNTIFLILYMVQMVLSLTAMAVLYTYNRLNNISIVETDKSQTLSTVSSLNRCFSSASNVELKDDYRHYNYVFVSVASLAFFAALFSFTRELLQKSKAFSYLRKDCIYSLEVFVCVIFIVLWLGCSNVISYTVILLSYECQPGNKPDSTLLFIAAILGFMAMLLYVVNLLLLYFAKRKKGNRNF